MKIGILGPLSISIEDRERPLGSERARTILALLAVHPGRVLTLDKIVEEVWGERPIANTRNALHVNIVRLRKLLGSACSDDQVYIRTVNSGYVLDVPREAVDATRFLDLADRGAALVDDSPHDAIRVLEEALSLWRGEPFLDISGGDRCRAAALRLEERRLGVVEDLTAARLAIGEERSVVTELRALVAKHPERERLSELLMLALYRGGRQSEALAVFHSLRAWLDSELGLEPNRDVRRLHQAILVQDKVLG